MIRRNFIYLDSSVQNDGTFWGIHTDLDERYNGSSSKFYVAIHIYTKGVESHFRFNFWIGL